MTPAVTALITFVLVALSMGGLLLALFMPQIAGAKSMRRRREAALGLRDGAGSAAAGKAGGETRLPRRSVEETMRDLDQKNRAERRGRARTSLTERLRQAGLKWTAGTYRAISLSVGLFVGILVWGGLGFGALPSAGFALAGGLWLPHAYVNSHIKRRQKAFTTAFPDAVDIIVRGVRAGIPVGDCMRIVSTETQEPVRSEFRTTVEDLTMGLAIEAAVQRMSERVKLEEARFFSIVITIQSRTGGNLSEALANLSVVLRDRAKMRRKIRSMSSEAKASAGIIGSLPPIVCLLVFLTSPEYVGLLFSTFVGNLVLAGSGLWMLCGILIMRKMINFDF